MTPDESDALFDQALKLERRGDREAAIEIYDRLAKELAGQENAEYAVNSANRLREYEEMAQDLEVDGDYWRDGEILIVRNDATLPNRCIKSNTTELLWPSRLNLVHLTISESMIGWIVGPLAGLVIRPSKISFRVAFAFKHWLHRNLARLFYWLSLPILLICIFTSIISFETEDKTLGVAFLILAAITLIAARVCDAFFVNPVRVKWVRRSFAGIKGSHPEYLAELPEWPFVWYECKWHAKAV